MVTKKDTIKIHVTLIGNYMQYSLWIVVKFCSQLEIKRVFKI